MKILKLALLGCGGRAYLADNAHHPEQGFALSAISDPAPEQMERYSAAFRKKFATELPQYTDYREMIAREKPDGVLVITPDFAHEQNAIDILNTGTAVYLEKPLAISIASCDRILAAAKRTGAKLMIGHNMRYMPFSRKIKEVIDSGMIGDVRSIWCRHFVNYGGDAYFTRWMSERDKVNSLLLQKGAHDIDLIHWFANSHTRSVVAMGNLSVFDKLPRRAPGTPKDPNYGATHAIWPPSEHHDLNPVIDVNDHNMIMMELANGVQAVYCQSFYTPDSCRNYTVIGTAGRIENYGDYGTESTVEVWNQRHMERGFNMKGDFSYDTTAQIHLSHGGADIEIIQDFVKYLRDGKHPAITPQDSRAAVAAGCAGADSIRGGSVKITVPELADDLKQWIF